LRRLAGTEDRLRSPTAKRAVLIHLGEPEILIRQPAQSPQRLLDPQAPVPHIVEQLTQRFSIHPRSHVIVVDRHCSIDRHGYRASFGFERGLSPRNPVLGKVSEGAAEAPSELSPPPRIKFALPDWKPARSTAT